MDIADDIAYSTYDLEDSFKANFLEPLDLVTAPNRTIEAVAERVADSLENQFKPSDVLKNLRASFRALIPTDGRLDHYQATVRASRRSKSIARNGYERTSFTSALISNFIQSVQFEPNEKIPALSKVQLEPKAREQVEVLKHFSYESIISSPDLKVVSYRGRKIVTELFGILMGDSAGHELLPRDFRKLFYATHDKQIKSRVVCDFISSMTDKYAIEYFGRLTSESPQSFFKKLA